MNRALALGIGILVVADLAWFCAVRFEAVTEASGLALWLSMPLAAFACAATAPGRKTLLGTLLAAPATLLLVALNMTFEWVGASVDFAGVSGALMIIALGLPFNLALCALGAAIGNWATSRGRSAHQSTR